MAATASQAKFLNAVLSGHNVVLLGKAGTGKTYILKKAIAMLKNTKKVQVTSSTGISSTFFSEARTLHSFSGIWTGHFRDKEAMLKNVKARSSVVDGWKTIECLIIDEISQISSHVLETVDYVARSLRENDFPFGGIQLIMSGDFFQLPPVANAFDPGAFAFTSSIWELAAPHLIVLEKVT